MMRSVLLTAGLVLAGLTAPAQQTVTGSIRFGGVVRDYRLYLPKAYTGTQPVPLLLNLHGYGSNNVEQEQYGDFRAIADTANFLVVHPNGTLDGTNRRYWNTFLPYALGGPDDVGFLSALIDSISAKYRVNAQRVYSTGMSNGGFMSYELACQLSNRVAAIASVTGSMASSHVAACTPARAVPVLEIHGTADGTVPYAGNAVFVPIPELVAAWARRNGCNPTPLITQLPDLDPNDGSTAERQVFSGGRNGSVVEHYRIIGGGHTWPGAPVNIGVTNRDMDASKVVWRFLRRYQLSGLVTATTPATRPESGRLTVSPNPVRGTVSVRLTQGTLDPAQAQVTDAVGRRVPAALRRAADGSLLLSTQGWAPGTYWLRAEVNGQPLYRQLVKVAE
ncbi:T9SS type A sorting domain-containing protein [Hymenobacter sp. NST-14]|uniref:extracellular catalytic domain type 1 short-chain-length polyhydroxyalkanoate depolymerase n=1 Tax=Hymenobacter piscis TaxID=2839984 RepID=UPI001C01168D|nr:PHB depolymerase family esterase [Hymenobacter piscis]MBT9391824.1 T9SS type A sorting domain-containing protein [Hymenobacter piscis]